MNDPLKRNVTCVASPSLALTKYWGKMPGAINLPATGSVAVTLGGLVTTTTVHAEARSRTRDEVYIDGRGQSPERFAPFFAALRVAVRSLDGGARGASKRGAHNSQHSNADDTDYPDPERVHGHETDDLVRLSIVAESRNSFPTAAGIASSSSGFAALAGGCLALFSADSVDLTMASRLARVGSGSAARSVFGGFTLWPAGADCAEQIFGERHWPGLRIVVAVVSDTEKPRSSRDAMEICRATSPFFDVWTESSRVDVREARAAVASCDVDALGPVVRRSYLKMFSTMLSSNPAIVYWQPESIAILHRCEQLRRDGIPAWETMDAGPQVKVITLAPYAEEVERAIRLCVPTVRTIVAGPGPGLQFPESRADARSGGVSDARPEGIS